MTVLPTSVLAPNTCGVCVCVCVCVCLCVCVREREREREFKVDKDPNGGARPSLMHTFSSVVPLESFTFYALLRRLQAGPPGPFECSCGAIHMQACLGLS